MANDAPQPYQPLALRLPSPPAGSAVSEPIAATAEAPSGVGPLVVDCDRCSVRGVGCPDCVVTFLLGGPPDDVLLDPDERRALDVLSRAGLVPPLRMVQAVDSRAGADPA